jgi:hypothetical protein
MAPCSKTTLLDVIHAVSEYATSEAEIVATVTYLSGSMTSFTKKAHDSVYSLVDV